MHISWVFQILKWSESRSVMPDSLQSHGLCSPWNSPGQNTGVGSLSLLQIFPTQGLNPGLPHCGQILYQLSHQGSTDIWAIRWAISYQGSRDAKTTTKWKKLTPRWSWACSPQTCWPLRTDHPVNQGIVVELSTYPETSLPLLAFRKALLKFFEEFRVFGAWATSFPCSVLQ